MASKNEYIAEQVYNPIAGEITRQPFAGAPAQDVAANKATVGYSRKLLDQIFEKLDEDSEGVITSTQLRRVFRNLGDTMSDEDIDEMIDIADSNNDGAVSMDDFYSIVVTRRCIDRQGTHPTKKIVNVEKFANLCANNPVLVVKMDSVGFKNLAEIRLALRGKAVVFPNKVMIRDALRRSHELNPGAGLRELVGCMKEGNGLIVATNCSLREVRAVLHSHRRPVAASAAVIFQKLGIKPFEYGMEVQAVFQDGSVFSSAVLDITNKVLIKKFTAGMPNVAAFGREIGIPTEVGMYQMFACGIMRVAELCADIDYTFKEVEPMKKFLEDPDAFAF